MLTPNRKEFAEATRSRADTDQSIAEAARDAIILADCEAILVTQSEDGMTLVPRKGEAVHVPAHPVKVRDVSGAGDTVVAALALALAAGADWEAALRISSAAAAVAVSKQGTASVSAAELRRRILPHAYLAAEEKIVAAGGDLEPHLAAWRKQGLRIGFTNGCFDILHPGHVKVLTAARGACDRLIVGLNSDASVKRLKGEGRPVQNESARAEVLAALEAVDLVAVFEEDTPLKLITAIKPSVLVKGGDYTRETVVGHEIVEAHGGEVVLVDILPGHSDDLAGQPRPRGQGVTAIAGERGSCVAPEAWPRLPRPGSRPPMSSRSCSRCHCHGRRRWSRCSPSLMLIAMVPFARRRRAAAIAEASRSPRFRSRCSCWPPSARCGRRPRGASGFMRSVRPSNS